jgi:hypothetical protein
VPAGTRGLKGLLGGQERIRTRGTGRLTFQGAFLTVQEVARQFEFNSLRQQSGRRWPRSELDMKSSTR